MNSEIENVCAKIYGALSTAKQNDVNLALQIYELIIAQEETAQSKIFQYVCEIWGTVNSSDEIDTPVKVTTVEYEWLKMLHGEMVDAALVSYIRKGLSQKWSREVFYEHFWKFIRENVMWETPEEKAFAIYYIAIDARTPYFNVGIGLKMNDDDFSHIQDEIFDVYRQFLFINAMEFEQKTEKASLIVNLIDSLDSQEAKTVLMARIIDCYQKRIEKLISRIKRG